MDAKRVCSLESMMLAEARQPERDFPDCGGQTTRVKLLDMVELPHEKAMMIT